MVSHVAFRQGYWIMFLLAISAPWANPTDQNWYEQYIPIRVTYAMTETYVAFMLFARLI